MSWADLEKQGKAGVATVALCRLNELDRIEVRHVQKKDVGVAVFAGPRSVNSVLLPPSEARRVAAALLNAADEIEGRTPLIFLPEKYRGEAVA